jgi:iron complex transport system permease protein
MPPRASLARAITLTALLAGGAFAAIALALALGSVPVAPRDVFDALSGAGGDNAAIVRLLRLPRALAAFAVGALLAIAGALMQVMLRNPLADPYVLGISGGAAVGALAAMLLGATAWLAPAAFAGALASTLLVFGLARAAPEATPWAPTRLLLTGVVIAAGWTALVALMLALAPGTTLKGMIYWLLGDLSGATSAWPALTVLAVVVVASLALARDLNALTRGAAEAATLGVPVRRLGMTIHGLAALATAVAVTTAGSIGFVGLVVPHALRLAVGNDQRLLLPACALAGGTLLVIADTAARTVVSPLELPVGVLTALLGVPTFLYLLVRR